ncbi:unnamed protein product [Angiostrongylus costaricensis]|uniref:Myosuppressin n=1 Tax=Angiostrongylus costaricensis TaxID=334426 RepID=A0A0R3PUS9_ANGCS|nr:unnamed protein product [Angiostrongylus costaricensis]
MWCALFFVSLAISSIVASASDEHPTQEFCRYFPSLNLCRLREALQGSLLELQYLLQDVSPDNGPNSNNALDTSPMEKHKSAFVRFGKRSFEDASVS